MRDTDPGTILFCALTSLGAGAFTLWFVWDDIDLYESVCSAFLSAPLWLMILFGACFYLLLGAAAALMLSGRLPRAHRISALARWLGLLLLCFLQAALFFRLEYYRITFALTALILALSLSAVSLFARAGRTAGLCLIPCAVWHGYLCYLGFTIAAGI